MAIRKPCALVLGAMLVVGCHESPQAPSGTSSSTFVTLSLDTLSGTQLNASALWRPALLVGADQSVHVVAVDEWNSRLRYHGCAGQCDQRMNWLAATGDTASLYPSTFVGAVLAPDGIDVVDTYDHYGMSLPLGIRYAHCAGGCQLPASWVTADLFVGRGWIPGQDWYGPGRPLAADSAGGLHLLFYDSWTLAYAGCAAGCADSSNWGEATLDTTFNPSQVTFKAPKVVAVAPGGTVHVLYAKGATLVHATCAAGCTSTSAWQSAAIPGLSLVGDSLTALALAFGPGGRLDLVYQDGSAGVTYATCPGPCSAPGVWSSVLLPLRTFDVSLATNRAGTIYLATTDSTVALSSCSANCLNAAGWTTVSISTALGVRGPSAGGEVAIALDSAGYPLVASTGGWPPIVQYSRLSR